MTELFTYCEITDIIYRIVQGIIMNIGSASDIRHGRLLSPGPLQLHDIIYPPLQSDRIV